MPARDVYHQAVKFALIKDGWTILAEDYVLQYGEDKVYADIAAEQTIAAQKQGRKIIVEVKSFLGRSFINDLEGAVGQYVIYRDILEETNSDFKIYLAITKAVYKNNFQRKLAQTILKRNQINLLIIEPENEVIEQWIE
ncbi:MAG TPA: XisH protein [Cyanobacteria bacterium UBA11372]|nr:XisH protein [Cyanobacteria bacterium UBA11372]HBE47368.1 XisH protein [Cyanobacteria bacterium UBA11369]